MDRPRSKRASGTVATLPRQAIALRAILNSSRGMLEMGKALQRAADETGLCNSPLSERIGVSCATVMGCAERTDMDRVAAGLVLSLGIPDATCDDRIRYIAKQYNHFSSNAHIDVRATLALCALNRMRDTSVMMPQVSRLVSNNWHNYLHACAGVITSNTLRSMTYSHGACDVTAGVAVIHHAESLSGIGHIMGLRDLSGDVSARDRCDCTARAIQAMESHITDDMLAPVGIAPYHAPGPWISALLGSAMGLIDYTGASDIRSATRPPIQRIMDVGGTWKSIACMALYGHVSSVHMVGTRGIASTGQFMPDVDRDIIATWPTLARECVDQAAVRLVMTNPEQAARAAAYLAAR